MSFGRAKTILLRIAISLAAAALLLELTFRLLLFVDVPGTRRLRIRLRQPGNFAEKTDPNYWKLSVAFKDPATLRPVPGFDPVVGWCGPDVAPGTYAHRNERLIGDRRPILLYGDSYARCPTERRDCWEGLLQRSELAAEHVLLNYGVGGFGFDQTFLMMRSSVDRFADKDPIVVVSLLIDDDLERSILPFRGWPKPLMAVEDGRLIDGDPVIDGVEAFLDEKPPRFLSYAWRFLVHGTTLLPASRRGESADRIPEIMALNRAILEATKAELDARELDWFVLLFYGRQFLTQSGRNKLWEERFLEQTLDDLSIPYVTARRAIVNDRYENERDPNTLFGTEGRLKGHYTPLGNEVVFQALRDGINGDFEVPLSER